MATMYVSYDLFNQKGEKIDEARGHACFSQLFYREDRARKKIHENSPVTFKNYYWVMSRYVDKDDLAWFEKEVIPTFTPNHLKEVYSLTDDPLPDDVNVPYDYWKTLTVDLTKITADELYTLLALVRYPQENESFLELFRSLVTVEKKDLDLAFLCAHRSGCAVGAGHLLLNSKTKYWLEGGNDVEEAFSFKTIWENLKTTTKNDKAFVFNSRKYANINEIFSPIKAGL